MWNFKLWQAVACVAVVVSGAGRSEAASYKLADLLAGGSFVSGDERFSNFKNFSETGIGSPLGAENIFLIPMSQPNPNLTDPSNWPLPPGQPACANPRPTDYGFRISGGWYRPQNQTYHLSLDFDVQANGGEGVMYGSQIELTGYANSGSVDAALNVTSNPLSVAMNRVWVQDPGLDNVRDRQYFTSSITGLPICVSSAQVNLGLQLQASNVFGAAASLDYVDIYFARTIPEPSTYALLVLGVAGWVGLVRRKRA